MGQKMTYPVCAACDCVDGCSKVKDKACMTTDKTQAPAWVMLTPQEAVAIKKSIKYREGAWTDTVDFAKAIEAAFIAKQGAAK